MSTTVLAPSGLEISSNTDTGESAESMLETLSNKGGDKTPRVLVDKGTPVKDDGEKDETQKAASVLGKKGGEAAAEARKLKAKSGAKDPKGPSVELDKAAIEDAKEREAEKAKKAAKGKAEGDGEDEAAAEGKDKKGNPRHDPEARVEKLRADIAELARQKRELRESIEAERRNAPPARTEAPPAREARTAAQPAARATEDDPSDPRPKLDDYDGDGAYERFVEDTSRWAARDEHRKVEAKTHLETARRSYVSAVQTDVDTFHERVTGLKKDDPGQGAAFAQFMDSLPEELLAPPSIMVPEGQRRQQNLIADIAMLSPKPREIYEYFADNMDDYQRIAALRTRDEIIGEMAILKHRLDAVTADTSSRREVSKAGSPPRSVSGTPRAAEPDLSGELEFDEHQRRKRAAQK